MDGFPVVSILNKMAVFPWADILPRPQPLGREASGSVE